MVRRQTYVTDSRASFFPSLFASSTPMEADGTTMMISLSMSIPWWTLYFAPGTPNER
jgi:hypothetical protein